MTGAISSTPFIVFSVTVMWLSFDFYLPQSIEPEAPYFEGKPNRYRVCVQHAKFSMIMSLLAEINFIYQLFWTYKES